MSDLLPFRVVTMKNVSKHRQMSPEEQNYPHCRNSSFQVQTTAGIRKVCLLRHLISHLHSPNHYWEGYCIKVKSVLVYFLPTTYIFSSQETGQTFKPSFTFKYLKALLFSFIFSSPPYTFLIPLIHTLVPWFLGLSLFWPSASGCSVFCHTGISSLAPSLQ